MHWLKNSMEKNFFNSYFWIYETFQKRKNLKAVDKYLKDRRYSASTSFDISRYKSSDILFVLGSGSSINKIESDQWEQINKADSIGLNWWIAHEFTPTYYSFESSGIKEDVELMNYLFNKKSKEYKDTCILVRGIQSRPMDVVIPDELSKNVYVSIEHSIPGATLEGFEKSIRRYNAKIELGKEKLDSIPNKRGSLSYLIMFGLMAGYKKIVLCGIDLNNVEYFFQSEEFVKNNPDFTIDSRQDGKVHRTLDSAVHDLSIDKVVYKTKDELLDPRGIELFVGSSSSALFPKIPVYEFD